MPIGAHVSTSGGISTAVARAQAIGAECVQVFLCAPQRWLAPRHTDEEIARFTDLACSAGLGPNFAHAIYLINLASPDPALRERSVRALVDAAQWGNRCGLDGIVVHIGSAKGQSDDEARHAVAASLEQVLGESGQTPILLENAAGAGTYVGRTFTQIGGIIDDVGRDPRLGVCLDTAHAFASGYDLREDDGIDAMLAEIDQHVGLDRLRVVHANDSKAALGSAVDRHENIGEGHLGDGAFERLFARPALASLPWVLEVPGFDKDGPDAPNVERLKRLAGRPTASA